MAFYRKKAVPVGLRLKASWWTSVSFVIVLGLGVVVLDTTWKGSAHDGAAVPGAHAQNERRLSAYPDDLLIESEDEPHGHDGDWNSIDRYKDADNKYWLFVHVIGIGYMLLGLNTVCDIYFTGALDVMVEKWDIKPDVAGATFMAAGGSAPELFTSLIGATVTENDVGFSTIVGSAVFNVLFVIGCCGYIARTPIQLTWWPLFRDCTYYIICLGLLAIFAVTGQRIELHEAIILFLCYLLYCTLMYFNEKLEEKITSLVTRRGSDGDSEIKKNQVAPEPEEEATNAPSLRSAGAGGSTEAAPGPPEHHLGAALDPASGVPTHQHSSSNKEGHPHHHIRVPHFERHHSKEKVKLSPRGGADGAGGEGSKSLGGASQGLDGDNCKSPEKSEELAPPQQAVEEEEDDDDDAGDDIEEMMTVPDGNIDKVLWVFKLPIFAPLYYLIPKPTERWFLATFFLSLLWIAGFSFCLVWWVEIICGCFWVSEIVAGFTVLAAGTSIPDLVSSMAVARAGEGDMAVSSSIGSNIFDILVGLPIPWMVKIVIVEGIADGNWGHTIKLESDYITVYVLLLLFMVGCVILSIHVLGWKLNRCLGAFMAVLYALFLIVALTVEITQPKALRF
mmetsp:Transcript_44653/g.105921  ORF Transcript_44653/g.105921 Transcript_44653/m.105921 type:complete len:618 (-) Transcript_44653:230-2083(-)|eukprot:CAMPEP_0178418292 /NCGR_PEP_ID=MMETSP0689_2-20121128/25012_1 /TAXON_ID=160604 /ORGANISM="Amphidinium massartii, Strain CS-259" /LENGTH=617 /DNA_ID=CAMNT_0020039679 /DNA_START=83 /DNA_END=1936 /DNA_ORIENTATION=-